MNGGLAPIIVVGAGAVAAWMAGRSAERDYVRETATMRVLGPIGDKVLFENEFVRVWSVTLDPGQRQPWHQHLLPYLIVPLTEGKNEMTFDDGRVRQTQEKPGEVIWREPGIPHELLNCSDWQYRNVLVEIKAGAGAEALQAIRPVS
jgi:beta-alanine degradation protein BauB